MAFIAFYILKNPGGSFFFALAESFIFNRIIQITVYFFNKFIDGMGNALFRNVTRSILVLLITILAELGTLGFIENASFYEYADFKELAYVLVPFEFLITDFCLLPLGFMVKQRLKK